jgi:hypothetical protein
MTIEDFIRAAEAVDAPEGVEGPLRALWLDARGQWDAAHRVVQDIETEHAAWVHAYLHRKEGDAGNAGYWYRRAGKPHARVALEDEWRDIAQALLE